MKPTDINEVLIPHTTYLFSEEELQNIAALLAVLKKIRIRLVKEGVDIDQFAKEKGIRTPFDN